MLCARHRSGKAATTAFAAGVPRGQRLPAIAQTGALWRWPLTYLEWCRARHGSRFTLTVTSFPKLVFLSDPAEVKATLSAPADALHPGEGGGRIAPIVGAGSFMLKDGEEHLRGRRAVLPALRQRTIQRQADRAIGSVRRAVGGWPRDVPVAMHPLLRCLTLEVILHRIFARQELGWEERLPALRDRVLAMLTVTESLVLPVPILRHGPGGLVWERFLGRRSDADRLIYALIEERRRGGSADRAEDAFGGASMPGEEDALGMLLAARNHDGAPMGAVQLRDNVMSLILAGHETTASQLAWAFQLLAHNPRVQERLIAEIDSGAGDEYLTATIQEVLRHRPVFLFAIPRAVKRPIEIGGRAYAPPAHLLACIYLLHHDPRVYPEPDVFRPERFLEGQPHPEAWLPWGGGRKRCPGSHLAMLEMKTVLRTALESVTVSPAARRMERPRWRSVIVTPHAGSRVVLHRRVRA